MALFFVALLIVVSASNSKVCKLFCTIQLNNKWIDLARIHYDAFVANRVVHSGFIRAFFLYKQLPAGA